MGGAGIRRAVIGVTAAAFAAALAGAVQDRGAAAGGAAAQESRDGQSPATGNCIQVERIRASEVVSNRRIRLKMRGGPDLMMRLERQCPQLAFHGYFTYEPTLGQICAAIDHILTRAGARCVIAGFSPAGPAESAAEPDRRAVEPPS